MKTSKTTNSKYCSERIGRALGFSIIALLAASSAMARDFGGHWEGEIEVPGTALTIKVDLTQSDGGSWSGTIDIPQQGAQGVALSDFKTDGETIEFSIAGVPGTPTFSGTLLEDRIEGKFRQGGATLGFWLGRDAMEEPKRPQDPEPPFPYLVEEVEYNNGEVKLAGTLTLPEGDGPFPAALLITGSGPQDRDEALLGHRPFLVLADHLTRAGIAVLRVDDRGVGGSTGGSVMESTTADFAGDVVAGVDHLSADPRIGPVGVVGHSEGGVVGPMAATRTDKISFVVMMAGTGVPGAEILTKQLELIARANGGDEETVEKALELQRRSIAIIASDAPRAERVEQLRAVVDEQLAAAPETADLSEEDREKAEQQAIAGALNPWFEAFVVLDPREALRAVKVPVLALNGDLDLQVDADQNLPEIARALVDTGNEDVSLRRFPGLNHLFQTATTGSPAEYSAIEETIAPVVLDVITDWILDRFGTSGE